MSNKEIEDKIKSLEEDEFYATIADHLDDSDYEYLNRIRDEIKELKGKLKDGK